MFCLVIPIQSSHDHRPDPAAIDPSTIIAPYNGFAMTFREFIPHLGRVLESLGLSIHARTAFIR